jgi:guanine nucleotide-binding protein subunit beta-2-like 1 protein
LAEPNPAADEEPQPASRSSQFTERATLKGHNCSITSLQVNNEHQYLVSGSRDRTALVWKLHRRHDAWGVEDTRLVGHNHFVSGVCFSSDWTQLLTSSWDKTARLWDLQKRVTKKHFLDHKKDVLAVTFSPCNRRIITCSRDKTVKLWNVVGECKVTLAVGSWATCVACAPNPDENSPLVFAVGLWDGHVRVWSIGDKVDELFALDAHDGRCLSIMFTPNGEWLVSGGTDRKVIMWNVGSGQKVFSVAAPNSVNAVAACPTRTWVCAATYEGIAVWDIQEKAQIDLIEAHFPTLATKKDPPAGRTPDCTALTWADDGSVLYAGYNNGEIRVWEVHSE